MRTMRQVYFVLIIIMFIVIGRARFEQAYEILEYYRDEEIEVGIECFHFSANLA